MTSDILSVKKGNKNARQTWSRQLDFVISSIGYAVGFGNIWRFPYLCYKNGGGAFFIPYIIMLMFGGLPIFILEVALGQYMSRGGLHAWDISPISKGIGYATTVILFLGNSYYVIILAWAVFYFVMSLTTTLPWSDCNNEWNTDRCLSGLRYNICIGGNCTVNGSVDSTVEFWERRVLKITDGIDNPGGLVWELAVCLLFVWILLYFFVWRGISWSGKVVYFTALFPYVLLTILLIRAVTLDGASDGITYYLKPDFKRLADAQVWIDGGTQIFFSYGIALSCMISLGSYNKFQNKFYRQCLVISLFNSGTSVFGGFIVFSVLGFMAREQNVDISKVVEGGPGLTFIAYPKAVSQMPAGPVWAALFFFSLFLIGIDSEFVGIESLVTNIIDSFPRLNKTNYRMVIVAIYCCTSFLIGLSMVSKGGMYVFQLFDYYSASGMVLLYICCLESVVIGWVFGADKFYDVIELMIGYRLNKWMYICWKYATPALTMGILLFQIVTFKPLTYNNIYNYPVWAQAFGIMLALASMICVPLYIIVKLCTGKGTLNERFIYLKTPLLQSYQIPKKWNTQQNIKSNSKEIPQEGEIPLTKYNDTME